MVTTTSGTATFIGLQSNRVYSVDMFISDVDKANVTFGIGTTASSTSKTYFKPTEDVVLTDLSIVDGPTVITTLVPTSNDAQLQAYRFRYKNFLNTLTTRPKIQVGFKAGNEVSFIQSA